MLWFIVLWAGAMIAVDIGSLYLIYKTYPRTVANLGWCGCLTDQKTCTPNKRT